MSWKNIKSERIVTTCKNPKNKKGEKPIIYSSQYHGCCSGCPFLWGNRGDSWIRDTAGCNAPADMEYKKTITLVSKKKYRLWNKNKRNVIR